MRVLHLTSHLNVGGVTSALLSLSQALVLRRHEVIIASGGGGLEAELVSRTLTHWRAPLHTSVEFSPQVVLATHELAQRMAATPVDIIHAHTRVGQVVADRLSRRLRVPYITTWHGFFRPNLGRWLWPCTGHLTIAISEPVRQHLMATFHVPPQRIRLIPHGIDPAPFEAPIESVVQQQARNRWRLGHDGPVIGTVARLVPSKGVDQLIRSLPAIRRSVPAAQLLIVGDGEARDSLQQLAASQGLAEAVHFTGALSQTRVALSLMNVFVFLPAEQEGFGLSLLEAMAGARPIVAVRRGGGASWVLEEAKVGLLVEPGNSDALAEAIVRMLRDGETACRAAGQARTVVKERYSLARMADQVESIYKELVDRES